VTAEPRFDPSRRNWTEVIEAGLATVVVARTATAEPDTVVLLAGAVIATDGVLVCV
jgi:hypothetical protein